MIRLGYFDMMYDKEQFYLIKLITVVVQEMCCIIDMKNNSDSISSYVRGYALTIISHSTNSEMSMVFDK